MTTMIEKPEARPTARPMILGTVKPSPFAEDWARLVGSGGAVGVTVIVLAWPVIVMTEANGVADQVDVWDAGVGTIAGVVGVVAVVAGFGKLVESGPGVIDVKLVEGV
jgi:hypothetical protein